MTLVFGTTINLYNMTSNKEEIYMKKLGIVGMNNFVVRAIVIRFNLKGRNYVWSNKTSAFGALFFQLGLQDVFKWKTVLNGAATSRRNGQFGFLDHLNPSSYAKVVAITISFCQEEKSDAWSQTSIRLMSDGKREDFSPQDGPESKNVQHESSWKFRGLQLWCFEFFDPRSFTAPKLPKTELMS